VWEKRDGQQTITFAEKQDWRERDRETERERKRERGGGKKQWTKKKLVDATSTNFVGLTQNVSILMTDDGGKNEKHHFLKSHLSNDDKTGMEKNIFLFHDFSKVQKAFYDDSTAANGFH
jgi:hypothetical protein